MAKTDGSSPYQKKAAAAAGNRVKRDAQAAGETTPTVHPGGRPRTAQNRVQFTLKTLRHTRLNIKRAALEHGCTASDVVDELARQFLDKLDWSGIEKDV